MMASGYYGSAFQPKPRRHVDQDVSLVDNTSRESEHSDDSDNDSDNFTIYESDSSDLKEDINDYYDSSDDDELGDNFFGDHSRW